MSKRPFESNSSGANGRKKWRKSNDIPLNIPPGSVVLRILCPVSQSGSVIGKGGGIISRIRQESGARVKLEDIVPGCEERVIIITGLGKETDTEVSNKNGKQITEDADADADEVDNAGGENKEEKEDSPVLEGSKSEKASSSAQRALFHAFERIIEDEAEESDHEDEKKKGSTVSVRLLILPSQVGCVLGKGGSVIKQMVSDSGAEIRVLAKDKIPACASPHDEIVQITGGIDSARKALQLVSQILIENPPRGPFPITRPPGSSRPFAPIVRPDIRPNLQYLPGPQGSLFPNRPFDAADMPPFPNFHEDVGPGQIQGPPELLIFRLLCSNERVGNVIGRGGVIVKSLQQETGCEVKIHETPTESDDRIIAISSPALPINGISPAQDGVLRVQHRIAMAVPDDMENVVSRILIPSYQVGCILGKGGAIISEMRKLSGAHIRLMPKDHLPPSVPENDELVQITGQLRAVQGALLQITDKLKHHLFCERGPAFYDQMPPFDPYMGRREPSPPRMFSNLPPFQKDFVGRVHTERFAHTMHGHGAPPHGFERIPPTQWAPQGMREGGGSLPIHDYPGEGPHRRFAGFSGGSHPAVITSTTVDVVVPRDAVPSIYGEDGFCLRQIREISEAKITITETRPEATETVIIIYGTPEQTHAAQSLIQAFVLSENDAA